MSQRIDVDLETDKALVDGAWVSRDELWSRMNEAVTGKDYKNIARFAAVLDALDQALAGAQTITIKLSQEHFAKLEAAGQKLGKSASAFAREVLSQVLSGNAPHAAPAAPAPVIAAPAPVIAAPAPAPTPVPLPAIVTEPPKSAPVVIAAAPAEEIPEEAALIQPKRRDPIAGLQAAAPPPVMTPVVNPLIQPPVMTPTASPSVVVDLGATGDTGDKPKPGGDGRRWFNRTT